MSDDRFNTHFADVIVKLRVALPRIAGSFRLGIVTSLPDLLARDGFASEAEFWEAALGKPMTIEELSSLLSIFHIRPELDQQHADGFARMHIKNALNTAKAAHVPIFLSDTHLAPKAAIQWLIGIVQYKSLVPKSAQAFLTRAALPYEPKSSTADASIEIVGLSPMVPAQKRGGGAPPKYNWSDVKGVVQLLCAERGGPPRKDHPDTDWNSNNKLIAEVRQRMSRDWVDGEPSDSMLKKHVSEIIKTLRPGPADN